MHKNTDFRKEESKHHTRGAKNPQRVRARSSKVFKTQYFTTKYEGCDENLQDLDCTPDLKNRPPKFRNSSTISTNVTKKQQNSDSGQTRRYSSSDRVTVEAKRGSKEQEDSPTDYCGQDSENSIQRLLLPMVTEENSLSSQSKPAKEQQESKKYSSTTSSITYSGNSFGKSSLEESKRVPESSSSGTNFDSKANKQGVFTYNGLPDPVQPISRHPSHQEEAKRLQSHCQKIKNKKIRNQISDLKDSPILSNFRRSETDAFDVRRSRRLRKRAIPATWLTLKQPGRRAPKSFKCYNAKDINMNTDFLKEKIVDAEEDDDYATDDGILRRSVDKVEGDLREILEDHLQGERVLRSDTIQFLELHNFRNRQQTF